MKTDKMIDAMQYIDDDILQEVNSKRNIKKFKKKNNWIKYAGMVAGLALVILVSGNTIIRMNSSKSSSDMDSGGAMDGAAENAAAVNEAELNMTTTDDATSDESMQTPPQEPYGDKEALDAVAESSGAKKEAEEDVGLIPLAMTLDKIEDSIYYGTVCSEYEDAELEVGEKVMVIFDEDAFETDSLSEASISSILSFYYYKIEYSSEDECYKLYAAGLKID